ncbi:MAG: hypothetical protein EOO06_00215 [Chitinophagaceae bacterium]|nr:MAG: hypothetical protein EOO06_00215 [Chitinophagaceae bacterium]
MKNKIDAWKNRVALFVVMMLTSVYTFAQEQGVDVSITKTSSTTTSDWYMQPWVWIVGGLVFVLLLAAMLSGGRSRRVSDGTTVHRTTITRRDDVLDA